MAHIATRRADQADGRGMDGRQQPKGVHRQRTRRCRCLRAQRKGVLSHHRELRQHGPI